MGIAIAVLPCSLPGPRHSYCELDDPTDPHWAAQLLYNGALDLQPPSFEPPFNPPYNPWQNFTVTIPADISGKAQIKVARAYCWGVSGHPTILVVCVYSNHIYR